MERFQDLAVGPVLFRPIIIGQIAAHDVTDGSGTYVSGGLAVPILSSLCLFVTTEMLEC